VTTPGTLIFYDNTSTQQNLPDPTLPVPVDPITGNPVMVSIPENQSIFLQFNVNVACASGGDFTITPRFDDCCGQQSFSGGGYLRSPGWEAPRISVTKNQIDPTGSVNCGQQVTWAITVSNNGETPAAIIRLVDTLDDSFTFDNSIPGTNFYRSSVNDTPYLWESASRTLTWEIAALNAGESRTYTLKASLDGGIAAPGTCSANLSNRVAANWGCLTTGAADGDPATDEVVACGAACCYYEPADTAANTVSRAVPQVQGTISISPTTLSACTDQLPMTVTINMANSNTTAYRVDLRLTLPPGVQYIPGTTAVNFSGVTTTANPGIVMAGASQQLIFYDFSNNGTPPPATPPNDLPDLQPGTTNNTVTFQVNVSCFAVNNTIGMGLRFYNCCGVEQPSVTRNITITAAFPQLAVTKTLEQPADCGPTPQNATWRIDVTNNGPVVAEVVRIEDTLGPWITYQSSSPAATPMPAAPTQTYGWEINNLGINETRTFRITGSLNPVGYPSQNDCTNTLRQNAVRAVWGCIDPTVTPPDAEDGNPNTTAAYLCTHTAWANATPSILPIPDLTIIGDVTADVPDECDSGTVTVTVANPKTPNGLAVSNFIVRVTGDLTGDFEYTEVLAEGESDTIQIDVDTTRECGGPYDFTVTVDATNVICECNETNNRTSGTVTIPCPTLRADKTLRTPVTTEPCEDVTYDVTISNTIDGTTLNWAANAVIFEETLPSGWVFDRTDSVTSEGGATIVIEDITGPDDEATEAIQWTAKNPITLNGGQSFTIRYTIRATTLVCGDSFTNSGTARARRHCGDEVTATAPAAAAVTVECPDIALTKTYDIPDD
jgi:uncharacterized repeat protein (TIGR01451 family)